MLNLNNPDLNFNNNINNFNNIPFHKHPIILKIVNFGKFINSFLEEKVFDLIIKIKEKFNIEEDPLKITCIYRSKIFNPYLTLGEQLLLGDAIPSITIHILKPDLIGSGGWFHKEINIEFIKITKNISYKNEIPEIFGLLKLCLLKELSPKLSDKSLKKLPEIINYIIQILRYKAILNKPSDIKKNIIEVLKKLRGSNKINFSNFVDEVIDSKQLDKILHLLSKSDFKEMNDLKYILSKYNKSLQLFNKEFEKSKRESILEFSIISLVVIEREDFKTFEKERKKCPNKVERILYHGTSIEPASNILTGLYKKSMEKRKAINGKGVYFTDLLDYAWYYGSEKGNRANFHSIPTTNDFDTFTIIINSIYFDRNGFKKVDNGSRTPEKNQINFAYSGARSERLTYPDKSKFYAGEYVIYDLDQICPFMSAKLKRVEYCVIWRDTNFSPYPVYNNKFDDKFKAFLKERMKYINQNAKYNIYPCETSEEALELVNRKKYNKIILISNVGKDKGGKKFVEKARQIIGNDVIALFLAYKSSHLYWIKNFKNAIFSNEIKFYEDYLQCFEEGNVKSKLKDLINKIEENYNVKFNFDDSFLNFPYFKLY